MRAPRTLMATSLVAATVSLVVAGCGVPTGTGVQVDGPVAEEGGTGGDQPRLPPGPDQASTVNELIHFFLQAAAGDPVEPVEQVRAFLHRDQQQAWRPDGEILLVRVDDIIPTPVGLARHRVELHVRVAGVLRDGMIIPHEATEERTYEFQVVDEALVGSDEVDVGDPRWRILDAPDAVLLSDQALSVSLTNQGYLEPSPLYFWDSDRAVLVPDLRWLPTAFPARQRAQLKLQWLFEGPAPWLDSVTRLPGDVGLEGNIVWADERVDVTLTPAAKDVDHVKLDTQLWWTLRDEVGGDRQTLLTIDGDERPVRGEEEANAAAASSPASFLYVDGALVPYLGHDETDEWEIPDVSGVPGEVHAAALNRDGRAALVHLDGDGSYQLTLAGDDGLVATDLRAAAMGRPLWLPYSGGAGLVAADGDLYQFSAAADPVPVPAPGVTGAISAFAVAPDGRRMALVADGELYVASLSWRDAVPVVSTARWLPTTGDDLAGVTFLQENWLAVIGRAGGRSLLYELTIDGAIEQELVSGDVGAQQEIGHMVGYPGDVLAPAPQRGEVMYYADDLVYRYRSPNSPELVSAADLGLDPDAVVSGPRAPLFLE